MTPDTEMLERVRRIAEACDLSCSSSRASMQEIKALLSGVRSAFPNTERRTPEGTPEAPCATRPLVIPSA